MIHRGLDDSYPVRLLYKRLLGTYTHTHTAGRHQGSCASPPVRICILLLAGRPTNCPGSRGRRRLWLRGGTLLKKRLVCLTLSVERASHLTSRGRADRGGQARTVFWRSEGLVAMAGPTLPWARRGSEASVPPRARLRPAALGLSFTNQAPFFQSKMPTRGNWSKVLLSALNNSPPRISSHKWTIY